VENKVNSSFQPSQAARYRRRGNTYRQQGKCDQYATVLVAPQRYVGNGWDRKGFDAWISYEALRQWFQAQDGLGNRRHYKQALLAAAIEKGVLGYQPEADAPVTAFWQQYWTLCQEVAPSLEMGEPTGKPAAASFVYFRPGRLPKGIAIVHKLTRGCLDLQFDGHGEKLSALHAQFGSRLVPGMTIVKAGKSGAIRLRVPPVDPAKEFAAQQAAVQQGVAVARQLLCWYAEGNGPVNPRIGYTS